MGNLVKAEVKIRGTRPLLQHAFTPDALPLEKQERTGVAGNDPFEWRRTALITKQGQLYLPPEYIFSALRNGAKFTKKGKGSIQGDVAATLIVTDDIILLNRWLPDFPSADVCDPLTVDEPPRDKTQPVFLDVCSVRNPSTKARNVRYRVGASTGWELTFNILWDKTIVNRAQIESVCKDTGILVGLADGRGVGYGRFEVVSFNISDV